ncbi:MAG: M48 family metallopeptidase [Proteobacteria bacterium]|nr:M48 family metallopeptidase [Pseudomonadota bacterium]
MNFFEAQDKARRNTSWLILLFIFAVAGLVFLTNLLLLSILIYSKTGFVVFSFDALQSHYSWEVFLGGTIGVCLLIFAGSLYKTMALSGGGTTVAEMLGGRLVPQSTTDLQERRLLNVVEEMAIAAGMPIPKVYLMDEHSINAFAAGQSPANAVIGVTYGTLTRLNREELQGVIAHEFSHIINGDMRLNIRLIGVLHGILLIGIIGYLIVVSMRFSRVSRSRKGGGGMAAILALGLGLMVIGYAGTFFGQWIKAVVSRQREYLADSSAVQFTRNKDSIAGALKKIGGASAGSFIESPAAPEYSHAYFANGISSFWQSLFATHPPLEKRIKKIDPMWDGKFLQSEVTQPAPSDLPEAPSSEAAKMAVTAAILSSAEQAINQIGTLNEANIEYAHELIMAIPATLRNASQDAFTARALIYAILIREQSNKKEAWSLLKQYADQSMPALTEEYLSELNNLDEKFKLPLLELSINALRELSTNQFIQFKRAVNQIIVADKMVDLNEWIIQRLVLQQLDQHFGFRKPAKAKHASLNAIKTDVGTLLSLIAYVEHQDDTEAKAAFDFGARETGVDKLVMPSRQTLKLELLNRSLDNLMQLKPLAKPRFLKACVATILADSKTTTTGIELVRTISTCLDCPMPPLPTSQ